MTQPEDDYCFDIEALPDEAIIRVFRAAGGHQTFQRLASQGSSQLHRLWQSAVRDLYISCTDVTAADGAIIAKYGGLDGLGLNGLESAPLQHAFNLAVPSLERLKSLEICSCPGGARLLRGCTSLQGSLEELVLECDDDDLTEADLRGLQGLTKLTYLFLRCNKLEGSLSGVAGVLAQLSSLRQLGLSTDSSEIPAASQAAVLPGSLTQLTYLKLHQQGWWEDEEYDQETIISQQQALVAALRHLTNLQRIDTNYMLMAPAEQQQVLGRLQQLTELHLTRDVASRGEPLVALPQLSRLVMLKAGCAVINPFQYPSLQTLAGVQIVQGPPAAPGQQLQHQAPRCPLQRLELNRSYPISDDDMLPPEMPQLPELSGLSVRCEPGADSRFRGVRLLRRQAHTLQELQLVPTDPFEEALPRVLPACRTLRIGKVSRHTLQLLRTCSLPALEVLRLDLAKSVGGLDAEADFGWLRELPALRHVGVCHVLPPAAGQELQGAVSALMQGSGVEMSYGESACRMLDSCTLAC